jgi:hypothetical protein
MTLRLTLLAACGLLLAGCSGFEEGVPVYLGENRVGTLNAPRTAPAATATAADECQALALRAADPSITDAQRRAAAEYRASLGC